MVNHPNRSSAKDPRDISLLLNLREAEALEEALGWSFLEDDDVNRGVRVTVMARLRFLIGLDERPSKARVREMADCARELHRERDGASASTKGNSGMNQ